VLKVDATSSTSFRVSGELDLASIECLRSGFATLVGINTEVVLDVRDLKFMDCAGLHAILDMANGLGPDGRVVLFGVQGEVARIVDVLRIADEEKVEVEPC
jgi:anti-anti-sigma factor